MGGAFGDVPEKPKGMHWRTFDRLVDTAGEAYAASWRIGKIARMLAKAARQKLELRQLFREATLCLGLSLLA